MNHRLKIGTAILTALLLTAPPGRASAGLEPSAIRPERRGHSHYDGVLPDKYYDLLARCETGHNWAHSTRSYTGGLGIARGTWQRWSNSSSAKGKTPAQQVAVADNIAFLGFTESDGEFVWPVGPWGWGCVKKWKSLQSFICRSRHKAVQRWKRGC